MTGSEIINPPPQPAIMKTLQKQRAFTLVELLCASAVSVGVLTAAATGVITLQRSFAGFRQYTSGTNDSSRVADYLSRDLRNATKVSQVIGGTATPFKTGDIEITDTNQLVIFVPDYYLSNVPDNSTGSNYKK